jgi:hypothetical protein
MSEENVKDRIDYIDREIANQSTKKTYPISNRYAAEDWVTATNDGIIDKYNQNKKLETGKSLILYSYPVLAEIDALSQTVQSLAGTGEETQPKTCFIRNEESQFCTNPLTYSGTDTNRNLLLGMHPTTVIPGGTENPLGPGSVITTTRATTQDPRVKCVQEGTEASNLPSDLSFSGAMAAFDFSFSSQSGPVRKEKTGVIQTSGSGKHWFRENNKNGYYGVMPAEFWNNFRKRIQMFFNKEHPELKMIFVDLGVMRSLEDSIFVKSAKRVAGSNHGCGLAQDLYLHSVVIYPHNKFRGDSAGEFNRQLTEKVNVGDPGAFNNTSEDGPTIKRNQAFQTAIREFLKLPAQSDIGWGGFFKGSRSGIEQHHFEIKKESIDKYIDKKLEGDAEGRTVRQQMIDDGMMVEGDTFKNSSGRLKIYKRTLSPKEES